MDRPGTGKRRVRSGAVRATEIIDRATRRFPRHAAPAAADARAAGPVPAEADAPEETRSPASRAAKLAGLALAALTLCGTVGAAVAVSRERGETASAGQAGPITGPRALLPDDLAAAVSGTARPTQPPRTAASTAIVGAPPASGEDRAGGDGGDDRGDVGKGDGKSDGTRPAAEDPEPPPSTAGMSDEDLVAEYYRLVREDPVDAFGLLSGTSFGADLGHFISSWSGVTDVRVGEIRTTADGVLADVRMLLATGQTLWVRQLFDVTETTPRRIANVTLLSAQVS
ncbi:hypothetical protein ACFPM7_03760 [Actinokineospora guangxiensis]|uniref:SnoaL-like domain-containing protein n=1 Tax=Actinokineospora guangxiensis TaxID=1490288 RepID=A0ABW0EJ44_9PSEU